jgi:hypothetical protein
MYEDIDEAHRIITKRVHNATTKYGYECRGGYKARDGYLYIRDYHKRKYLLDSVETFAGMLCGVLEGEGIPAYYERDKVLRIPPRGRYSYCEGRPYIHVQVPTGSSITLVDLRVQFGYHPLTVYDIVGGPKFVLPTIQVWRYMNLCVSTQHLVYKLNQLAQGAMRYAQCKGCYYTNPSLEYCGMGVPVLDDVCRLRADPPLYTQHWEDDRYEYDNRTTGSAVRRLQHGCQA